MPYLLPMFILLGLAAYTLAMLGIGLYASRRVSGSADYLVAGRRLSLPLATATLSATWFGGGLCIGAASAAYGGGFRAVIADPFGAALCLFLAGAFYVRVLRRMGIMTIASFFTERFNGRAGMLASMCTIPAYVGWVAALMVAFGRILQSLTGLDPVVGICVGAGVVLIYTYAGGMWAVTLTDFVQLIILVLGMVVLTPILLSDMGGWTAISARIPAERFDLYPHDADASAWFDYARDWLVIGLGNLAGQDLIQRSLSSRDDKVAVRSAYLSGVLYLTVGLLPVLLGMAGAVVAAGTFAYHNSEHFARRIDGFLSPDVDPRTQLGYATDAIREGGFFGVGVGEGSVKWSLPDAHTDFIIAVAAEEYGLILVLVIIALYTSVVVRSLLRLMRERDPFIRLAGTGLAAMFAVQAMINMGVAVRLLPAKGMTLPFVSYGGSSVIASGVAVGMLLAFTRSRPQGEIGDILAGRTR